MIIINYFTDSKECLSHILKVLIIIIIEKQTYFKNFDFGKIIKLFCFLK